MTSAREAIRDEIRTIEVKRAKLREQIARLDGKEKPLRAALKALGSNGGRGKQVSPPRDAVKRRILGVLRSNPARDYTVRELASEVGATRSTTDRATRELAAGTDVAQGPRRGRASTFRLKRSDGSSREAVTRPGEGVREGRLKK